MEDKRQDLQCWGKNRILPSIIRTESVVCKLNNTITDAHAIILFRTTIKFIQCMDERFSHSYCRVDDVGGTMVWELLKVREGTSVVAVVRLESGRKSGGHNPKSKPSCWVPSIKF